MMCQSERMASWKVNLAGDTVHRDFLVGNDDLDFADELTRGRKALSIRNPTRCVAWTAYRRGICGNLF